VKSEEQLVIEKIEAGESQKGVANELGITEWAVRTILRSHRTRKASSSKSSKDLLKLSRVTKEKVDSSIAIILSDVHIPFHCPKGLAIAIEFCKDLDPSMIILNGDILDFYEISTFKKDPLRIQTLQDELDAGRSFLRILRKNHPDAEIWYLEGNHEVRARSFLSEKAESLASLRCLSLESLLDFKELRIKSRTHGEPLTLASMDIFHGKYVRKHSGSSAKAHADDQGGSLLVGHVHRQGIYYKTDRHGTHAAVENGHLACDDVEYVDYPNWQMGFTVLEYFHKKKRFSIKQHCITNGKLLADGVIYSAG